MLRVFVAQHHAEAHLVRGLLQAQGIDSEVRGEALFTTVEAGSVIPGARPEVWVLDPSQAPQALEITDRFAKGEALQGSSGPPWQCPACGESHESQFTSCWKCGSAQPGPGSSG